MRAPSRALRGVSLSVAEGEVVAVLGTNGAGKTTLLRAISGTLRLHRGRVDGGDGPTSTARDLAGRDAGDDRPHAAWSRCRRGGGSSAGSRSRRTCAPAAWPAATAARASEARERVYELFPVLARARAPARRPALRRRAADAGDRPGADGQPEAAAARRAVARAWRRRSSSEIGEVIARDQPPGHSVLLVEQNATMALGVADARPTCSRSARCRSTGRPPSWRRPTRCSERYLGHRRRDVGRRAVRRRARGAAARQARRARARRSRTSPCASAASRRSSDVSFTVEPGTVHALIGPNGAGKSTCSTC